jgi:hypothetical protein
LSSSYTPPHQPPTNTQTFTDDDADDDEDDFRPDLISCFDVPFVGKKDTVVALSAKVKGSKGGTNKVIDINEDLDVDIPDHLKCPISTNLFQDPVVIESGNTVTKK